MELGSAGIVAVYGYTVFVSTLISYGSILLEYHRYCCFRKTLALASCGTVNIEVLNLCLSPPSRRSLKAVAVDHLSVISIQRESPTCDLMPRIFGAVLKLLIRYRCSNTPKA